MNVVTYIRNPSDPTASPWTFCATWWEFVWKIGQVVTKGELHLTFPLDQAGDIKTLQKATNTTYMKSAALSTRVCDWDQWVCSFGQRGDWMPMQFEPSYRPSLGISNAGRCHTLRWQRAHWPGPWVGPQVGKGRWSDIRLSCRFTLWPHVETT